MGVVCKGVNQKPIVTCVYDCVYKDCKFWSFWIISKLFLMNCLVCDSSEKLSSTIS